MVNQRDVETAYGTATVGLPSRTGGLPLFPAVPTDLAQKTTQMWARHVELGNEAGAAG